MHEFRRPRDIPDGNKSKIKKLPIGVPQSIPGISSIPRMKDGLFPFGVRKRIATFPTASDRSSYVPNFKIDKPGETGEAKLQETTSAGGSEIRSERIKEVGSVTEGKETRASTLQERHPDWPIINFTVAYNEHGSYNDMAKSTRHLKGKQIYFHEDAGGNGITEFMQSLATNIDPSKIPLGSMDKLIEESRIGMGEESIPVKGSPWEAQFRALDGTGIVVAHADLRPEESQAEAELKKKEKPLIELIKKNKYIDRDFTTTLENLDNVWRGYSALDIQREQIIATRFEDELGKVFDAHPELKEQDEVDILKTIGALHSGSFDRQLNARGIKTKRVYSQKPYEYSYTSQIWRYYKFFEGDSSKKPSRDLFAKALLENIISEYCDFSDTYNSLSYQHTIASHFTTHEIEAIHGQYVNKALTAEAVNALLGEKGLGRLPQTDQELADFLTTREKAQKEAKAAKLAVIRAEQKERENK